MPNFPQKNYKTHKETGTFLNRKKEGKSASKKVHMSYLTKTSMSPL